MDGELLRDREPPYAPNSATRALITNAMRRRVMAPSPVPRGGDCYGARRVRKSGFNHKSRSAAFAAGVALFVR